MTRIAVVVHWKNFRMETISLSGFRGQWALAAWSHKALVVKDTEPRNCHDKNTSAIPGVSAS